MLATIPTLLGAAPHESIVIVGIGARGELSPVARIDIDACTQADAARAVARECTGHLARAGAERLVIVAFSDSDGTIAAVDHMRDGLRGAFEVSDVWVVARGRYRSPDCVDPSCCPQTGRPLPPVPRVDEADVETASRLRVGSHHAAPAVPRAVRKPARDAFRRAITARNVFTSPWRQQMLDAWRSAQAAQKSDKALRPTTIGRLAAGLLDTAVRDAVVIDLVPGESAVADGVCRSDESGVREALARMIGVEHPAHPPHADVQAAMKLAEQIAWVCPEARGPAYAIIAIARWWSGDLDAAEAAVATSLDAEPGYRLAELIAAALTVKMPPGWLRAS